MKTNADPKIIAKAVETVSKNNYGGNVIFLRDPQQTTRNVTRFVVKTKDRNGPGAYKLSDGTKISKANLDVNLDVVDQIFKMEKRDNIYVDIQGDRIWKDERAKYLKGMVEVDEVKAKEPTPSKKESRASRIVNAARKHSVKISDDSMQRLVKALKYVLEHEDELLVQSS